MIEFTDSQFGKLKEEAEINYKKIGIIRCPYLQSDISFNAKGLDHLKLKQWNPAPYRELKMVINLNVLK